MASRRFTIAAAALFVALMFVLFTPASSRIEDKGKRQPDGPQGVLVLDGTTVHNVGELQMHFLNWGEWGSRPGTAQPYSLAPSAQWPAGSGVEYLFSAGLWVGAIRNGIPSVTTAAFEQEFRPPRDPRATVYKGREGDVNGNRQPSVLADDDDDGRVDEDRLDGFDNDMDGRIDEDFAAISTQMFTCRFTDDEPVAVEIYPDHNPLNISVRQQTYQWDSDRYDDFIAIEYTITNIGDAVLEELYIGMFVDGDAGPRDRSNYWKDDMVAFRSLNPLCTDLGPTVPSDIAYTFDADGDGGITTGLFGITVLGHPTDPRFGSFAPPGVGLISFRYFSGNQAFQLGGDPSNDFERYELLANGNIAPNPVAARDYRMMVGTGPFAFLEPDSSMVMQFAFVCGGSERELVENATSAQLLFDGAWFDLDRDATTGIEGRETPVWGPQISVWEDSCRKDVSAFEKGCDSERLDQGRFSNPVRHVPEGVVIWQNADCTLECLYKGVCGFIEEDSLKFRSGVGGRESLVRWVIGTPPPPPNMRVNPAAADGVELYWDNHSEVVPDNKTQRIDFEGYRLWRAANWTRPIGTSVITGPPTDLWGALVQIDLPNGLGEDTGIEQYEYEPLRSSMSPQRIREFVDALKEHYDEFPEQDPPCPQGVDTTTCDTLKTIALSEMGLPGGRTYYRFLDREVHEGAPYFYAVVAFDHGFFGQGLIEGVVGDPASNFTYVEPTSAAQPLRTYDSGEIYVVPNPATRESMEAWALGPTNDDPSGEKIEFRNLPATSGSIRVYTIAGDLVQTLAFDGRGGNGTVTWDLISHNGQNVASGIYLYSVEMSNGLDRVIGKFVVIR